MNDFTIACDQVTRTKRNLTWFQFKIKSQICYIDAPIFNSTCQNFHKSNCFTFDCDFLNLESLEFFLLIQVHWIVSIPNRRRLHDRWQAVCLQTISMTGVTRCLYAEVAGENVRWLSSWWRLLMNAYRLPFNVFASSFGYDLSYNTVIYLAFVFLHYFSRELILCFPDLLCLIYVSHFRPGQYWILSIISVTCSILRDGKGR